MKPYLIRTPPFDQTSGGIKVMWGLFGWLLAKGQIAYVNTTTIAPSIGIYPEIYHGNDMASQKVVRYILQTPGVMSTNGVAGPTKFDPTDELFYFSRVYAPDDVDGNHVLFLPIIDQFTFRDYKRKRTKTAFYCSRGENLHKHPDNAIEITREFATDQQALADLLNECEVLYVYDKITAMMEVARLCGCRVDYWGPDMLYTLEKYEPGMNGILFKGKNVADLVWNSQVFRDHYRGLVWQFGKKLDKFIRITQA